MAGPLVSSNGGQGFLQQGSLDWVALSKSTMTYSVEVMSRMSRAGVDMITVAMGQFICSGLVLTPEAQKRIFDALSSLKSFSSYGKFIWFGFGVKHIVKDLAETEQGAACIALCACLAVSYDDFFAATVLRELCRIRGSPSSLTPSIHQWKALVNVCAGSISSSQFPNLIQGLVRVIPPHNGQSLPEPTTPEALAKAIGAVADVSSGKLLNTTIVGGLDCLWLAAVSQWLLSLHVQVSLSSGPCVYRSFRSSEVSERQVLVVISDGNDSVSPLILNKSHVVPPGRTLWNVNAPPGKALFVKGRSEWSSLLIDTFGSDVTILFEEPLSILFAKLLLCASRAAEAHYHQLQKWGEAPPPPCRGLHFGHNLSRGRQFLTFASQSLPEIHSIAVVALEMDNVACISWTTDELMQAVQKYCGCISCSFKPVNSEAPPPRFCLRRIIHTVIFLLQMLSSTEVDTCLKPSSSGLQLLYSLYKRSSKKRNNPERNFLRSLMLSDSNSKLRSDLDKHETTSNREYHDRQHVGGRKRAPECYSTDLNLVEAVFLLFSGSFYRGSTSSASAEAALCQNGVCIYFRALADINLPPPEVSMVCVVAGHIEHEGITYKKITDVEPAPIEPSEACDELQLGPQVSCDLVVKETPDPDTLFAGYRVSSLNQKMERWLGPSALAYTIARLIQRRVCCQPLCRQLRFPSMIPPVTLEIVEQNNPPSSTSVWASLPEDWCIVSSAQSVEDFAISVLRCSYRRLYTHLVSANGVACLAKFDGCHSCAMHLSSLQFTECLSRTITVRTSSAKDEWYEHPWCIKTNKFYTVPAVGDGFHFEFLKMYEESNTMWKWLAPAPTLVAQKAGTFVFNDGTMSLLWAINTEAHEYAELLLKLGADASTIFKFALTIGASAIVRWLIDQGFDLEFNLQNTKALQFAAERGDWDLILFLLEKAASGQVVFPDGSTILHAAVRHRALAAIRSLLRSKSADIEAKASIEGETALHTAVNPHAIDTVTLLLDEGADINATTRSGSTALHLAIESGNNTAAQLLIERGANIDHVNGLGQNPIQLAIQMQNCKMVDMLQQTGAQINAVTEFGSALHVAATFYEISILKLLLDGNPDLEIRNYEGETALQVASAARNVEARDLLEAAIRQRAQISPD